MAWDLVFHAFELLFCDAASESGTRGENGRIEALLAEIEANRLEIERSLKKRVTAEKLSPA